MEGQFYSGVAKGLADEALAAEVARQMLASLKGERSAAPLSEAVRAARAAGLGVSEMERMSGYTRQTISAVLRELDEDGAAKSTADVTLLTRQVLVALCAAGGQVPLAELASRLRLAPARVHGALLSLRAQGLATLDASAGRSREQLSAAPGPLASDVLRALFDDLFLRRPDSFSVYLRIEPEDRGKVEGAARRLMSINEHTLMDARVAPSVMSGPELVLAIHAPTSRMAVQIACDIWGELRKRAKLPEAPPQIADVIGPSPLPCGESAVLDAFMSAIAATASDAADGAMRTRMRYPGGVDEHSLACRALTSAARVLRRSLDQPKDPRPISDAEAAWSELEIVRGLRLDKPREPIRRAVEAALELAADRLGPFRGGELGSVVAPGGTRRVLERIRPAPEDLVRMAELAGRAVGAAARVGTADAATEMLEVIAPQR